MHFSDLTSFNCASAHRAELKWKGTSEVSCAVVTLCGAVTRKAVALRGFVALKWALRASSYSGDCCSLKMAYTWLSTS